MNTNTMELNMNEMEMVAGGGYKWGKIFDEFDRQDVLMVLCGGPLGEAYVIGKLAFLMSQDNNKD